MSDVLTAYRELEQRLLAALTPSLSEAQFGALALEVHAFQRRWNSPYARYCETLPPPMDWREIPAVPLNTFKRYALSCVPLELATKTFLTSGTTGESRGAHHFFDPHLYEAALLAGWSALGLPQLRQVILAPHPENAPQSSLSHMLLTLAACTTQPQVWCIRPDGSFDLSALRAALESSEPIAFLGTALAFLNLFEQNPTLPPAAPGSFAMETGGYKGTGREIPKPELYARFTQHLGLPSDAVWNEYGMTELSSQFYTRGLGAPHTGGPWIRALVIDPESGREAPVGELGTLRIFDLANLNSVLALQTQDLAIRRVDGFELIGRDPSALPRGCSRSADELLQR